MFDINVRGTFFVSRLCIPFLKKSSNSHILYMSPPLNLDLKWLVLHEAYTMSKMNMTMVALALAEELRQDRIACNRLWPRTTIATAAVKNLLGGQSLIESSRIPDIAAARAFSLLQKRSDQVTGPRLIAEAALKAHGVADVEEYSVISGSDLYPDLFL